MPRRRAVGAVVTAVAAVLGLVVMSDRGGHDRDPAAGSTPGGPTSASPSGGPTTASPSAVPDEGAIAAEGAEVIRQPENAVSKGLPGIRQAKRPSTTPLVSAPLPRTATRRGAVADGFPVSVIPVLTGATVSSSGVSSTLGVLRVSIVATSPRSPGNVLAFYRKALSAHGFEESTVPAVGGATASSFMKGADHLVVTATRPAGEDTTYSVFGDLHTGTNN